MPLAGIRSSVSSSMGSWVVVSCSWFVVRGLSNDQRTTNHQPRHCRIGWGRMTEVPQSFDRFEVLRVLGKGGMGTVYLARDPRLDRPVALKVLHAEDVATDERRARFLREARTAAAIRHPNVATIYEVGESAGLPFIVMEYCEGETLSQRLRNTRLETPQFLNIAKQIAAGVAAAHEHGIVHRDLKSANIIIEPSGHVKILDFGLAKALHREVPVTIDTTTGSFFGTI